MALRSGAAALRGQYPPGTYSLLAEAASAEDGEDLAQAYAAIEVPLSFNAFCYHSPFRFFFLSLFLLPPPPPSVWTHVRGLG